MCHFHTYKVQPHEQEHNQPIVMRYNKGNPCRPLVKFPLLVRRFVCPSVGT
jgi:hypothetical protein